jgi:glycine betaine/proline transport system substrate-binding protein
MNDFRLPLGDWVEQGLDELIAAGGWFFDGFRDVVSNVNDAVNFVVAEPAPLVMIAILVVLALLARGVVFAVGSAIGLVIILGVDQWDNAMDSLGLVLVAATIAILISVPVGILAAKTRTASVIVKPILDFMQTMPAFVYLIPALLLFRIGDVPGIVATVIFALAPGVRMTELGIRGVDSEVVEAAQAFGASPGRILRQVQLPLAMPSIMAGVNQVIMLSLSMVVIAAMVGAGGLGSDVIMSLNTANVALGFESGLSVVILAIFLDRLTASFSNGKGGAFRFLLNATRPAGTTSTTVEATADAERKPATAAA